MSEAAGLARSSSPANIYLDADDSSPTSTYKNMRQSLKPLPQAPTHSPPTTPEKLRKPSHGRSHSIDSGRIVHFDSTGSPPAASRPYSMAISRSDSIRAPAHDRPRRENVQSSAIERPNLQSFERSSTGHLRTLSMLTAESGEDFVITRPEQEVVGLHGRRRLQRTMSPSSSKSATSTGWGGRTWMDRQRQFLQAYEYLCHIGEAKEWIEDIIRQPIPPIVQLEQHLRDGVTLAEIVQALKQHPVRIFRHEKLQYRHTDNIALFFRYLAEVELPDLFRFELVDLYEKKNIPKVIYCIHALSWLLYRKGIVDFRIGNLVGQLQFEDHELEAMQKGLDKAGVSMPSFSGMGANFGVEPEPEPVESEEDRIDRELSENEARIADLQAQVRGAMMRMQLGHLMQELWDSEDWIVDLQSRIRGDWSRQVFQYRLDMKTFATNLQSLIRGFLVRNSQQRKEDYWRGQQERVVAIQSLVRARLARSEVQTLKSHLQRHNHGIRSFQAAIRGAFSRRDIGDQYEATREAEPTVQTLQALIRGAITRKQVNFQISETQNASQDIKLMQARIRGMLQRAALRTDRTSLRNHESSITTLQAGIRGFTARKKNAAIKEKLVSNSINWDSFQSVIRASALRNSLEKLRKELACQENQVLNLQSALRGNSVRKEIEDILQALTDRESLILQSQAQIRGFLIRRDYLSDMIALQESTPSILELQSACRGYIIRQQTFDTLCELNQYDAATVELQSMARACLLRMEIGALLAQLDEEEAAITELQSFARGMLIRQRFAEKQKFYRENMEKVIKVQSFIRGRQQGQAYKSLTSGKNPPVSTVKNFVHLLNDSELDFDEEIGM